MEKDYFQSVYKVNGLLPDPYGVLNVIKNAKESERPAIIEQIKKNNLENNLNIRREVERYEHQRDMSS